MKSSRMATLYGLRLISLTGLILFTALFAATYFLEAMVERPAKAFIHFKVEQKIQEKLGRIPNLPSEQATSVLARRIGINLEHLREQLKSDLPKIVDTVIAEMQGPNCPCRKLMANIVSAGLDLRIASLVQVKDKLLDIVRNQYAQVVQSLVMDLRIFTGSNAVLFLLLLTASWIERRTLIPLLMPSVLLMLSTLVSIFFYLFAQNWFYSIVYNDYVGFGYAAYVGVVFLFLCDIILNGARVTLTIIRLIGEFIGALLHGPASC